MGITYGDHLIDSGYYDITPEQEREIESENMKSTQAMRDRARELSDPARDDYDRAVICIIDDLEALLRPCGECHLQPGERCDICGCTAVSSAKGSGND